MEKSYGFAFLGLCFLTNVAFAQSVKSEVIASNGVPITLYSDSFAGRFEYSSPTIQLPDNGGYIFVSRVVDNSEVGPLRVVGRIYYSGAWRLYNSAVFRGGEAASGSFDDKTVVACGSSINLECSVSEGFRITLTNDQIGKYANAGIVELQLRAQSSDAMVISVPANYFEAIFDVAK